MKALKTFISLVAIIFGIIAFTYYSLPDEIKVEQSIVIEKPQLKVYHTVNDLSTFSDWSGWFSADPQTQKTLTNNTVGPNAKFVWASSKAEVGMGELEILESRVMNKVVYAMNFGPESLGTTVIRLEPTASGTKLIWSYETNFHGDFMGRFSGLFIRKSLEKHFSQTLENLKTYLESS